MLINKIFPQEYNVVFRQIVNSGTLDEDKYSKVHSVLDWSVMDKARDTGKLTAKEYDAVFTAMHDNIWNAQEAEQRLGRSLPQGFILPELNNVPASAGRPFFVSPSAFSVITQRNQYRTAEEYYKTKMGLITPPPNDIKKQQMFDDGHDFEEAFAKAFARKSGIKWIPSPFTYWNEDYPDVLYNTDGWLVECDENGKYHLGLYEGKTTRFNSHTKEAFDRGEVPDYYMDQLAGYFAGLPFIEFAYINCGWGINSATSMKCIRVERQESFIDAVMDIVTGFVEDAKCGIPPVLDSTSHSTALKTSAKLMYSTGDPTLPPVQFSKETGEKVKRLIELDAEIDAEKNAKDTLLAPLNEDIKKIDAKIKALGQKREEVREEFYGLIGDATSGVCTVDGKKYTFKYPAAKEPKFDASVKSFVKESYPEVWDELMKRYPKRGSLTYKAGV